VAAPTTSPGSTSATNPGDDPEVGPSFGDHWHASFQIAACGEVLPAVIDLSDVGGETRIDPGDPTRSVEAVDIDNIEPTSVHAHRTVDGAGDGLVHIHPFDEASAGSAANLGVFFTAVGITMTDDELRVPAGEKGSAKNFAEADGCGDKDAQLRMAIWNDSLAAVEQAPDRIIDTGFDQVVFERDNAAYTIFFGPAEAEIPAPAPNQYATSDS
jgi:hypothetical protein